LHRQLRAVAKAARDFTRANPPLTGGPRLAHLSELAPTVARLIRRYDSYDEVGPHLPFPTEQGFMGKPPSRTSFLGHHLRAWSRERPQHIALAAAVQVPRPIHRIRLAKPAHVACLTLLAGFWPSLASKTASVADVLQAEADEVRKAFAALRKSELETVALAIGMNISVLHRAVDQVKRAEHNEQALQELLADVHAITASAEQREMLERLTQQLLVARSDTKASRALHRDVLTALRGDAEDTLREFERASLRSPEGNNTP
jgi:hypothetical protein